MLAVKMVALFSGVHITLFTMHTYLCKMQSIVVLYTVDAHLFLISLLQLLPIDIIEGSNEVVIFFLATIFHFKSCSDNARYMLFFLRKNIQHSMQLQVLLEKVLLLQLRRKIGMLTIRKKVSLKLRQS